MRKACVKKESCCLAALLLTLSVYCVHAVQHFLFTECKTGHCIAVLAVGLQYSSKKKNG